MTLSSDSPSSPPGNKISAVAATQLTQQTNDAQLAPDFLQHDEAVGCSAECIPSESPITSAPLWTPSPRTSAVEKLTTEERFVLFAIQRSDHGLDGWVLTRLTGLPRTTVLEAVGCLESGMLITRMKEGAGDSYVGVPLPTGPCFDGWQAWLTPYYSRTLKFTGGDTLGGTYIGCEVAILTAIVAGSWDRYMIADVTSLPLGFVVEVFDMLETNHQWWADLMFDLRSCLERLREAPLEIDQWSEVDICVQALMEDVWQDCWTPDMESALIEARAGRLFGGRVEDCVDA